MNFKFNPYADLINKDSDKVFSIGTEARKELIGGVGLNMNSEHNENDLIENEVKGKHNGSRLVFGISVGF